tara:strand:- start:2673 stop:3044 length:372 start_codon:yes stop_codon:yes gene_type:complete
VPKIKEKESSIQKAVLDWLKYNKLLAVRLNNIPVPIKGGGFRPVSMKGLPDAHVDFPFLGIPLSVWVEFKTANGKLSDHQKYFRDRVEEYDGFYFVVRSIDEMEEALKKVKEMSSDRIKNLQL